MVAGDGGRGGGDFTRAASVVVQIHSRAIGQMYKSKLLLLGTAAAAAAAQAPASGKNSRDDVSEVHQAARASCAAAVSQLVSEPASRRALRFGKGLNGPRSTSTQCLLNSADALVGICAKRSRGMSETWHCIFILINP